MQSFDIHTHDTAPEASRPLLTALKQSVGMVPNLAAGMSESPQLLEGFLSVREIYQKGTFTAAEREVLSLTSAFENACSWCMAFHSLMAQKAGVDADAIALLRAGRAPSHARLGPLSDYARTVVRQRGAVAPEELQRFLDAGYTRAQALEVVLGMAFSLMANYASHVVDAPLDAPFVPHAWQHVAS